MRSRVRDEGGARRRAGRHGRPRRRSRDEDRPLHCCCQLPGAAPCWLHQNDSRKGWWRRMEVSRRATINTSKVNNNSAVRRHNNRQLENY